MFLNGVASVTVGGTAECEATWTLPLPASAFAGASVTWEILDGNGQVWNSGDGHSLTIAAAPIGTDSVISARSTIAVPIDAPSAASGTSYQVRWKLAYGSSTAFAFDSFTVFPSVVDNQGPASLVVLATERAEPWLTVGMQVEVCRCELFFQNEQKGNATATQEESSGGYRYVVKFDTDGMSPGPSLTPYNLLWRYKLNGLQQIEQANLWLVNPMMLQAQAEVRNFLLKAYGDSGLAPDFDFGPEALMQYLLQGAEMFNSLGYPTSFTMVRATGGIRALWLRCATIVACRSQYMAEGMKAFNFGGQVVNLDVDRSQYWDSLASQLQTELDMAIKPFKENLVRRGHLGGDGNVDANSLRMGAVGTVGIALTPISPIRGLSSLGMPRR